MVSKLTSLDVYNKISKPMFIISLTSFIERVENTNKVTVSITMNDNHLFNLPKLSDGYKLLHYQY